MSEELLKDLRHFESGGTVENPKALIRDAIARIEKLQSAAKTLGKIINDSLMDVAKATNSLDLLDEDRDGDWMLIFERLAELRPQRDEARAQVDRVRALVDGWLLKAGPESKAHNVYGEQMVTVKFAVESIRDAIQGATA